ncbi:sugar transferase [Ancylomarina longa]|uniref:Sugar transferase n=1 Tax=Ancylomarina longa TaxID=2487017 RepID=A0A434AZE0_9BACT|nr:sugar transferase [Ancylomarina longa]RUT79875.1 sugar transferase [Ancylomarina longa]
MKKEHEVIERLKKARGSEIPFKRLPGFVIFLNDFSDLTNRLGKNGFEFISRYFSRYNSRHVFVSSKSAEDIKRLSGKEYQLVISLEPINNLISINEFFEAVSNKLTNNGILICRFTPQYKIEEKILKTNPFPVNHFVYFTHFIFHRVFPKLSLTRNLYFLLTKGKDRSIRKLEMIGRLYACGYGVVNEYESGKYIYLVAKKQKAPFFDKYSSYGFLFKMKRIGKGGKEILVYKLRTMVPFSEYLQEEFIKKNHLTKGGKICNDSRITPIGRILRKFWIDEIPNFVNLLRGEMKLVGVRPISRQYLSLYESDLQKLRMEVKPGIIPPFYVDLPETLEEIQKSEKKYIESYLKNPLRTDIKYFITAFKNILFKRICST